MSLKHSLITMASSLHQLCLLDEFTPQQKEMMEICLSRFLVLQPELVLHAPGNVHLERDLLSHTKLALLNLQKTDRYKDGFDHFRTILSVLLHDVGKAVQWPAIDQSEGKWHFKGHDTVGACWFWDLVIEQSWDQLYLRPVFLAIWYHMVRSSENAGLLSFLSCNKDTIPVIECLHCCQNPILTNDDAGRFEVQDTLPPVITVKNLPKECVLPQLPIVLYIMGESGAGKTTLSRNLMSQMPFFTSGYVSHDKALLRVMGGITEPWADVDPVIRGTGLADKDAQYNIWYKMIQKDSEKKRLVQEQFENDFHRSLDENMVTLCPTTVGRPTSRTLPFGDALAIKIVTCPQRVQSKVFGSLRYAMDATRYGTGWAANGPLLFVPENEVIACLENIVSSRSFLLKPPVVHTPKNLIGLVEYWVAAAGSVSGMILAFGSYYDISVTEFECIIGKYYNFFYNDGAPYDDMFNEMHASPASFCRGTTLHYDEEDEKWTLVRLPMNRGREVAFGGYEADAEDSEQQASFYSKLSNKVQDAPQLFTAKVDGSLMIVFHDSYGIRNNLLPNSHDLVFGTKGSIIPNKGTASSIVSSLSYHKLNIEIFSVQCAWYMKERGLDSMCFEMVNDKLDNLVVDYPVDLRGLYFLGGSKGAVFHPFFTLPDTNIPKPETKTMTIQEAETHPLGPFNDHVEGSVVWVSSGNQYYPLKMKTKLYYILHTNNRSNLPRHIEYLSQLIKQYGWLGTPTYGSLQNKYLILSLFSLVNIPDRIISMIPVLKRNREMFQKLNSIQGTFQEVKKQLVADEFKAWCQFNSIYKAHRYDQAYELTQ